jgi:hypothetical protein
MTSKLGNMKFLKWQIGIKKWSVWKMENLHENVFKIGPTLEHLVASLQNIGF